jgi:hypothetical protein
MKEANATLKATLKNDLDIDAVEDLADDMAEVRVISSMRVVSHSFFTNAQPHCFLVLY